MSQATLPPPFALPPDDDETLYEVIDGRYVEKPVSAFATVFATKLALLIGEFLRTNPLGQLAIENLFLIDSVRGLQRRPDVAYVSYERWPREQRVPSTNAWAVVPDLAIEVISPTNTATEMLIKIRGYFRSGVRVVWVVYPVQELIYVYESAKSARILERGDTLEAGAVLPGFQLALAELFEPADEPAGDGAQPPAGSSA